MLHTEDNCAIYQSEMMPGVLEAFENLEALGKDGDATTARSRLINKKARSYIFRQFG
jgi:hypothetical protein